MQFTDRKTLPYGPYELYGPNAKFTDRYSAGILDNPQQGEKSNKYFLNLESSRGKKSTIQKIIREDKSLTTNPKSNY